MAAYADQIAAGGNACWRDAVRHAAGWVSAQHPTVDLGRQVPLPQLQVQAIALLVYGMAGSRDVDPATVCAMQILDWVADRQLPLPLEPSGPLGTDDQQDFADRLRLWRHQVDAAAERQCHDLAALLHEAGHRVPAPGHRSLDRFHPAEPGDGVLARAGRLRT
jgi:hypothetical protein